MAKFEKGQSGNPGGRPKVLGDVRELARSSTVECFATLKKVMTSVKSPPAARVAAAKEILDRAWGKSTQAIDVKGEMKLSLSDLLAKKTPDEH